MSIVGTYAGEMERGKWPSPDRPEPPLDTRLGARVRIVDARDIVGTVVAITHHIDGSRRYHVDYWANGSRSSLSCESRELEILS